MAAKGAVLETMLADGGQLVQLPSLPIHAVPRSKADESASSLSKLVGFDTLLLRIF